MKTKFVISDAIVKDTLGAVSTFLDAEYRPAVTGGMAIQLYSTGRLNFDRPTTDMDLLVGPHLTAKTFKEGLGGHLKKNLAVYSPTYGKTRTSFEVGLRDSENYPFFIHTYRQNGGHSFPSPVCVRRQVDNANTMDHERGKIKVVKHEDIIARKLRRMDAYDEHGRIPDSYRGLYSDVRNRRWDRLAEEELNNWLEALKAAKTALPGYYDQGEDEFRKRAAEYTIGKDLFDISLFSRLMTSGALGFDEKYYDRATQED